MNLLRHWAVRFALGSSIAKIGIGNRGDEVVLVCEFDRGSFTSSLTLADVAALRDGLADAFAEAAAA